MWKWFRRNKNERRPVELPDVVSKVFGSPERVSRVFEAVMSGRPLDSGMTREFASMTEIERAELAVLIQDAGGLPSDLGAFEDEREADFREAVRAHVDKTKYSNVWREGFRRSLDDRELMIALDAVQSEGYLLGKSPAVVACLILDGVHRYLQDRNIGLGFLCVIASRWSEECEGRDALDEDEV